MNEADLMEAQDMSVEEPKRPPLGTRVIITESLTRVTSPLCMCLRGSNEALEDGATLEIWSIARNPNEKAFL
jgi:hypothetical protein